MHLTHEEIDVIQRHMVLNTAVVDKLMLYAGQCGEDEDTRRVFMAQAETMRRHSSELMTFLRAELVSPQTMV